MISRKAYTLFKASVVTGTGLLVGSSVLKDVGYQDPRLLVLIPASIVKDNVLGYDAAHEYQCKVREELDTHCADANVFDKLTIGPVNRFLDKSGVKLHKDSMNKIKDDIEHSKQMSPSDPIEKKIRDYYKLADNQKLIASSFANAGEHEGALLHNVLSGAFYVTAKAYHIVAEKVSGVKLEENARPKLKE